jgi:P-type E1-E2 ATPase
LTFIALGVKDEEFNKETGEKIKGNKSSTALLFNDLPKIVNIVIIFIVVAIPEGIPLTIGISLAFSVMEMYNEKILIRKLDAPEKLGGIEEIIVGKTATITCNDMKVDSFYFEGQVNVNSRKDTIFNCEL